MTSPKIATFHDGLVLKWQGTKGTTATTAMWKLIHGGQQSRSHRHGGRQSAGVQLRTRRRFGMASYNSNLPEVYIYNSEFKGALDNLGLDFRKRNADLLVFISTGSTHSLSLSLKEDAPVTPLKANVFKRTTGNWKSLSYYILAQQGIPCFELPMMSVPCISHLTASDMKPQLMAEIRREQAGGTTQFLFKKTWQNDILDFFVM